MTDKSAAAAREIVERWMGKKHPITMQSYVSDLTALISEWYVSKKAYNVIKEHYQSALAAKDINRDYINKYYYPKEFVEWIGDDCSPCYLERKEDGYGKWVVFKRNSMEHEAEFDTLDELFNYWKENER